MRNYELSQQEAPVQGNL